MRWRSLARLAGLKALTQRFSTLASPGQRQWLALRVHRFHVLPTMAWLRQRLKLLHKPTLAVSMQTAGQAVA